MSKTTWRKQLAISMEEEGDVGPVLAYAPSAAAFDRQFSCDYGLAEGDPVLAWTSTRVYFPVVYDGAEHLGSAPRDPVDDGQEHVGGQ